MSEDEQNMMTDDEFRHDLGLVVVITDDDEPMDKGKKGITTASTTAGASQVKMETPDGASQNHNEVDGEPMDNDKKGIMNYSTKARAPQVKIEVPTKKKPDEAGQNPEKESSTKKPDEADQNHEQESSTTTPDEADQNQDEDLGEEDDASISSGGLSDRSTKAGKAAYARMVRAIHGKKGTAPPEVRQAFGSRSKTKTELFSLWLAHDGDWLEVAYSCGLKIRTADTVLNRYRLMSRLEIEAKFKSQAVVDGIIKTKTERGLFIPHPDAPDETEARLYQMFDTTHWDNLEEHSMEKQLVGTVEGLSPSMASEIATRMTGLKMQGPQAFSKAPALALTLVDPGTGATKATRSLKAPKAPGAGGRKMDVYFKCLAKALQDMTAVDDVVTRIEKHGSKADAFIVMLKTAKESVKDEYEKLREEVATKEPPKEVLDDMSGNINNMLAGLKVDLGRINKMFPDPDAVPKQPKEKKEVDPGAVPKQPKAKGAAKRKAAKKSPAGGPS